MLVMRFHAPGRFDVGIQTGDISRAWQRFKGRVTAEDPRAYARYTSSAPCRLTLFDPDTGRKETFAEDRAWNGLWPVAFETNKYQITIRIDRMDKGTLPHVRHARREVEEMFFADEEQGTSDYRITGTADFLNEPGVFRLEFEYTLDGRTENVALTWDVVSPKLDTKRDYAAIIRSVNREYEDIVFRYLATSYQQFAKGRISNDVVWLNAFEELVGHYLRHVEGIIRQPRTRSASRTAQAKADRIKRWTPLMEERYKEAEAEMKTEERFFRYQVADSTPDTIENRFVKHTVEALQSRLTAVFKRILKAAGNEMSQSRVERLQDYADRLRRLHRHPFFRGIGRWGGMTGESLVLQSRQGYMQVYKDWLKLRRGIDLYNGAAHIGTLQIWEIYELWCFVRMKQMVREVMRIPAAGPLYEKYVAEPRESALHPFTGSTLEHVVTFRYPTADDADLSGLTGEEREAVMADLWAHRNDVVTLHYRHTFSHLGQDDFGVHTATTDQRPDMVLNIRKSGSRNITLTYLYDAKYRVVDDSKPGLTSGQSDGQGETTAGSGDCPPADAINQMHRYRDAIYYGGQPGRYDSKEVIGGYILFPGRGDDKSADSSLFSESARTVNIGAFPLTPDSNEAKEGPLLRRHLDEILMKKTGTMSHVRGAIPQRGLKYEEDVPPSPFLLIGFAADRDLPTVASQAYYYVRAFKRGKPVAMLEHIDKVAYVLIHTGAGGRHVYRVVGRPEFISGTGLQGKGFHTDGGENDMYLGFHIDTTRPAAVPFDPYQVQLPPSGSKFFYSPKVRTLENPDV